MSLFGVPSDPLSGALSDPLSGAPREPPTVKVGFLKNPTPCRLRTRWARRFWAAWLKLATAGNQERTLRQSNVAMEKLIFSAINLHLVRRFPSLPCLITGG